MKKVIMLREGEYGTRHWFTSQKDADKFYTDNFMNGGKELIEKVFEMKDNQSMYAVHIAEPMSCPTDFNAMYVAASSEAQAKAKGREYIRAWDLVGEQVIKVRKVA